MYLKSNAEETIKTVPTERRKKSFSENVMIKSQAMVKEFMWGVHLSD